jgi:hypothetical protein
MCLPLLFFLSHAIQEYKRVVLNYDFLIIAVGYYSLALLLFLVFNKKMHLTFQQSLLLAFLSFSFFLFFGTFQDKLISIGFLSFMGHSIVLLTTLAFILSITFFLLKRKKKEPSRLNNYITLTFICLTAYELMRIIASSFSANIYPAIPDKEPELRSYANEIVSPDKPDIYHLVFDSYTSSNVLKKYWHYDNDINDYLERKGFFIGDSSISNYNFTPFSIASVFNLQYIKNADLFLERNAKNFYIGNALYHNNSIFSILGREGYQLSTFSILDNSDELNKLGSFGPDKPSNWLRKQTMERLYINPWLFNKFLKMFSGKERIPYSVKQSINNIVLYNQEAEGNILKQLNYLSKTPSAVPHFTYSHFTIPHGPYSFDKDGDIKPFSLIEKEEMKAYLDQVIYSNKKIEEIVNLLTQDSLRKKIIIIQGDHGFRNFPPGIPPKTEYEVLNAVFFFDGNYAGFRKSTSLVNTYRLVFNHIFDFRLPLLTDSIVYKK